jgi:small subunit ribosomal protein S3
MGQKVHPLGFRLGITETHRSQWFAKPLDYPELVIEDKLIRETIIKKYSQAGIVGIGIQRRFAESNQIKVTIRAYNPKILVGRQKIGLKLLRSTLKQEINRLKGNIIKPIRIQKKNPQKVKPIQLDIKVTQFKNPASQAAFIAQFLALKIENRVRFRFALKQTLEKAKGIPGIKIAISGRLNGAEIARSEWVRRGRVPLQTLKANIDYSCQKALTTYGLIGIKVWIFKGESVEKC